MVAGTVDGLVSIRRREENAALLPTRRNKITYRNVGEMLPSTSLSQDTVIAASNQVTVANPGKVSTQHVT